MADDASLLAILTRVESVNDRVFDISSKIGVVAQHEERLNRVEEKVDAIHTDIKDIKNGPVYSLDQFITKKVAQMTGGMGAVAILIMLALEKGLF
jgi:hypothetical protein